MADASGVRAHLLEYGSEVFEKALDTMIDALIDAAPQGETGDTKARIRATPLSSGGPVFSAFVESPTPQGEWYEEGTEPHEIVGNPLLAFEMDGELVIVHSVHHPGQPARPWFHPTLEAWPAVLEDAASTVH